MIVSVVNRATPVFTQTFYDHIFVSEDAQAHIVVSDAVKASSPDGSDVVYSIEDGDPEQQFDVDFNSGTAQALLAFIQTELTVFVCRNHHYTAIVGLRDPVSLSSSRSST